MKPYLIVVKYQSTSIEKCSDKNSSCLYFLSPVHHVLPGWCFIWYFWVPKIIIYVLYLRHLFQYIADCVCMCCAHCVHTCEFWSKHLLLVLLLGYYCCVSWGQTKRTVSVLSPPPLWNEMLNRKDVTHWQFQMRCAGFQTRHCIYNIFIW